MAAAEKFFMIGCEVGMSATSSDRALAIGKLVGKDMHLSLTKPAVFGTIKQIIEKYGVSLDGLPEYLQDALKLEATIQEMKYSSTVIGTAAGANKTITWNNGFTAPAEINKAAIDEKEEKGKTILRLMDKAGDGAVEVPGYEVKSEGKDTTKTYLISKSTYVFVFVAQYEKAWEIIPGFLGLKFLAFGISNDSDYKAAQLEDLVKPALRGSVRGALAAPSDLSEKKIVPPPKATNTEGTGTNATNTSQASKQT